MAFDYKKEYKEFLVLISNTVTHPRTMMVHVNNTHLLE